MAAAAAVAAAVAARRWTTWQAPRALDVYRSTPVAEAGTDSAVGYNRLSWPTYSVRGTLATNAGVSSIAGVSSAIGGAPTTAGDATPCTPLWMTSGAEPFVKPTEPLWWSTPWDSPEGTRAVLLRQIPAHLASPEIVRSWCTLYGDVASIRITKSDVTLAAGAAAGVTDFGAPLRPLTAFAVIQFYDEPAAVMALRSIEADVQRRIGSRVYAMPFPTITTAEILEQQCVLSTLVVVGVNNIGLKELMEAIKSKSLGVRGAFITSKLPAKSAARSNDDDAAISMPSEPANANGDLCIVLQFADARMAANVKQNFTDRAKGGLQAYYWYGPELAWPLILSWPSLSPPVAEVPAPTFSTANASTASLSSHQPWSLWDGPTFTTATTTAATVHASLPHSTPPTSPPSALYATAARRSIQADLPPLSPIGTPPACVTAPAAVNDHHDPPTTPPRATAALVTPPETPPSVLTPTAAAAPLKAPPSSRLPTVINVPSVAAGDDIRTTLMVKNIPNKYSPGMIIELLNATHFGRYTTMYLPMDYKNLCNTGYFFLDVVNAQRDIPSLVARFQGLRWPRFNSVKTADIVFADIQGQDALLAQFATSKIQWTARAYNPYRPRLFVTAPGPKNGVEKHLFTVTPEEARNGAVLELRPGRPVDSSIADDIIIAATAGPTAPGPMQKENEDPSEQTDRRGKIGRWIDATAVVTAAAAAASATPSKPVIFPIIAAADLW